MGSAAGHHLRRREGGIEGGGGGEGGDGRGKEREGERHGRSKTAR